MKYLAVKPKGGEVICYDINPLQENRVTELFKDKDAHPYFNLKQPSGQTVKIITEDVLGFTDDLPHTYANPGGLGKGYESFRQIGEQLKSKRLAPSDKIEAVDVADVRDNPQGAEEADSQDSDE